MADVRTLKLNLLADVDQFGKGLNKAGKQTQGFSGKVAKYGKIAAGALAAVGAAAAVMAVKLGVDAVKGAIEDEASQKKLAKALQNTTNATDEQIAATEDYISKTQIRYGISDVKLRKSLGNLARATGDVTQAQKLNNLAVDIAAATGKDLETVSLALSKASLGNLGALTKLGVPLDANIIKTKDFAGATDQLQKLFGGSALTNTKTLEGQLAIMRETFGELQEGVGVKFLPVLKRLLDRVMEVAKAFSGEDPEGLTARARELKGEVGDTGTGSLGRSLAILADSFGNLFSALAGDSADPANTNLENFATALNNVAKAINAIAGAYSKAKSALDFIDRSGNFNFFGNFKGLPTTIRPKAGAAGASVMANQPIRVGEFGSEVFIPSGSGSVRRDPGGGGNTFIFNGVIDAASARRSIERLLQTQSRISGPINLAGAMP